MTEIDEKAQADAEAEARLAPLLDGKVEDLATVLDGLTLEDLHWLHDAETHGKTRKGALAVIEKAIALLQPEGEPAAAPLELVEKPWLTDDALALVLTEDDVPIGQLPAVDIDGAALRRQGDRHVFDKLLSIDGDVAPCRITRVWLTADGDPVANCEIVGGIAAGGGRHVEFPAGHLIF